MAMSGTESPDTPRKPVVNFSRPRLASSGQTDAELPDNDYGIKRQDTPTQSNIKSVSAFHSPNPSDPPFPSEPRFSTDSETLSNTSANRGDILAAARRGAPVGGLTAQRHPGTRRFDSNTTTNTTSSTHSRPSTADSTKRLMPIKSILKQTSVEVSSERASSDGGEDTGSHHTVSEDGGSQSTIGYEKGGKWSSSDYDTSGMSEKEVQKLIKKGKNPALVAEMRAARKGKGIVGVMTGTSYVS
ncbi:hypothetical protein PRZ48_012294 [Zasmidium cellare]|uniref:Uncharacterized protein n=1 Tax=Zasmidium cellare TaxID=395010 RepID=A0ABR0E4H2_ZASCE|nr:hypothetical protein PRZ48_012294 [Zasmidium cellare]